MSNRPLERRDRTRLEQMVPHVRELETFLDKLVPYTRLQSLYLRADIQQVLLKAFLDSVMARFFEQADSHPVELTLELEQTPYMIRLDPRFTAKVIQNLVGNAMRYGIREARLTAQGRAEGLVIRVEGHSIGISLIEQERIRQPFYLMDRSRDRQTGRVELDVAWRLPAGQFIAIVVAHMFRASALRGARLDSCLPYSAEPTAYRDAGGLPTLALWKRKLFYALCAKRRDATRAHA